MTEGQDGAASLESPQAGTDAAYAPLVQRARDGDEAATDELLAKLAPQLLGWLERQMGMRLKRYLSVPDVAQESLASLLTSLERLREGADLGDARRLLFQHARWVVMRRGSDAGRFEGESAFHQLGVQDRAESIDRSRGPVTLEDELCWLQELIDELDPELRLVMSRRLQGAPFAQLAEELDLTESAIRKRFERGLAELQRLGAVRKS